jgi:predicted phosphoserine aminotransferase
MAAAAPSDREPIRFFLPGPAYVLEEVRAALTGPMAAHRSPVFKEVYRDVTEGLRPVFRTDGEVLTATGSATLFMESAVVSCVERDVLNLVNGAFSERFHAICRTDGKDADRIAVPWGRAVDPDLVRQALRRKRYEAVTLVHNETSTGVLQPLAELARVIREESDALILVDAVSSLGGAPVETDDWGLDVVLTASQKALALPPGLAFVHLSERAARRAEGVTRRGFYTDLLRYRDYHRGGGPITTPAVSIFYAARHQLGRIAREGIDERWRRHQACARMVAGWAGPRGVSYASDPAFTSPTVSCLRPPEGIAPAAVVAGLAERGFTVASGYGELKASTFRIGHMGEVAPADLEPLLVALDEIFDRIPTTSV